VVDLGLVYAVLALGLQLLVDRPASSRSVTPRSTAPALHVGDPRPKLGLPVELSFVAGGVVAALLGLTLVPILRLRGNELAVATLGFGVIVHAVILNEEWLTEGRSDDEDPAVPARPARLQHRVPLLLPRPGRGRGTYLAFRRLARSRFGRALEAIRQSEEAAVTSGINPCSTEARSSSSPRSPRAWPARSSPTSTAISTPRLHAGRIDQRPHHDRGGRAAQPGGPSSAP